MTLKSSSRNGVTVIWIVAHTAEGSTTKESLYRYFNQQDIMASSHVGIDAEGIADWVDRGRAAWTLRNGNPRSVNAELCGFARWNRAQWLSTDTVDSCKNPRQMIRNLAWWIVREARHFGIPLRKLTVDQVRGRVAAGYIDHDDYTDATQDGTHWDVGENFPWDVLAADIAAIVAPDPNPSEDDMPSLKDLLDERVGEDGDDALLSYRAKPGTFGHFLLGQRQYVRGTNNMAKAMMATIDALAKMVAEKQGHDPDETAAKVHAAVTRALAEGTVDVDITVGSKAVQ